MTFDENVKRLVQYGIESGLVPEEERIYTTNQLLELFGEEEYTEPETESKMWIWKKFWKSCWTMQLKKAY